MVGIRTYKENLISHRKLLIATESTIILGSFFASYLYVYGINSTQNLGVISLLLIISVPIIFLAAISGAGAWNLANIQSYKDSIPKVSSALFKAALLIAALAFLFHLHTSRLFILGNLGLNLILLFIARILLNYQYSNSVKGASAKKVLVIGKLPRDHDTEFLANKETILEFFEYRKQGQEDGDTWIAGLEAIIKEHQIDALVVGNRSLSDNQLLLDVSHFYRFGLSEIYLGTKLSFLTGRFEQLGDPDLIFITDGVVRTNGAFLKRLFDIVFSSFLILIFSPIMLITAIAIKLSSKGEVLYIANRQGLRNKPFKFPKFRTMYVGSDTLRKEIIGEPDEQISERYKRDKRITPIGRFLRRWSIDELPQLFSVLAGSMSIVGPRPILPEEFDLIPEKAHFRFYAKPGLTGLWQVSGRKEVDWETRMAQDVQYVDSWTLARDIIYIFKTIVVIIRGKGAY